MEKATLRPPNKAASPRFSPKIQHRLLGQHIFLSVGSFSRMGAIPLAGLKTKNGVVTHGLTRGNNAYGEAKGRLTAFWAFARSLRTFGREKTSWQGERGSRAVAQQRAQCCLPTFFFTSIHDAAPYQAMDDPYVLAALVKQRHRGLLTVAGRNQSVLNGIGFV